MHSYDDIGNGEVLVLLHGLGNRKEAWIPQHSLSDGYRLIIPDIIGHGNSPVTEDLTLKHAVDEVISLMDKLGIKEFNLCGLSLGGIVAQKIYFQHPRRVKRLVLSNTCSYMPYIPIALLASTQKKYLAYHEPVEFKKISMEHCLHNLNDKNKALAKKAFYIHENTYASSSKMAAGVNFYPYLHRINIPVLIISSTNDKVIKPYYSYSMHRLIRKSKLTIIPDAGHLSNIEQPEIFNDELLSFLSHT